LRRRTAVQMLGALALMGPVSGAGLFAQDKKEEKKEEKKEAPALTLKVGDEAPDFTLLDQSFKNHSLHDFKGKKNVALAFYLFAFSPG
jgi:cytochrome oxidase Cu insertion factor (SCO1/SenC/PrrC family)